MPPRPSIPDPAIVHFAVPYHVQPGSSSRCFAIIEFNTDVLSFDHRVRFLMNIFGKRIDLSFSHKTETARRRKAWFHIRDSRILFVAKQSWVTLRMSRPLFAGHVVGSRPMKRKKNCIE